MSKLILFSDGTGNSAAKAEKTNVWRLFQAIDQTTSDQLAMYDDGVGNSSNKYLAAIGGAFGWGLKRNVIDLYIFVCRNFHDVARDQLYGFGFSRGAFTIRTLVGLIVSEGLVSAGSEEELREAAHAAYARFRRRAFKAQVLSPPWLARHLLAAGKRLLGQRSDDNPPPPRIAGKDMRIEFLGLWDTVGAYGMPIEELQPAISWLFWPMSFTNLILSPQVRRACHALSIDDERTTFHPIVWDEEAEERMVKDPDQSPPVAPGRITQVWYAGVHANVGGGYPEDQLSLVSLDWMMSQARQHGLRLQDERLARVSMEKSPYARLYDARVGKGVFYRYDPRTVSVAGPGRAGAVAPVIHGSVLARMAFGSDGYVPNSLPLNFKVLAADGTLIPMAGNRLLPLPENAHVAPPNTPQILDPTLVDTRTEQLQHAIAKLSQPDPEAAAMVLDAVWWRRLMYFASALLALMLAIAPWGLKPLHGLIARHGGGATAADGMLLQLLRGVHHLDRDLHGFLIGIASDTGGLFPAVFSPWVGAVRDYPVECATLAGLFWLSLHLSDILRVKIRDWGMLTWHAQLRPGHNWRQSIKETAAIRETVALVALLDMLVLVLSLQDIYAGVRTDAIVLAAGISVLAAVRIWRHRRTRAALRHHGDACVYGISSLALVRPLRTSAPMRTLARFAGDRLAPLGFGLLLVYLLATLANRAAFDAADAVGAVCTPTFKTITVRDNPQRAQSDFDTGAVCWASGLRLQQQTRYRIIIDDTRGDWFDAGVRADAGGFEAPGLAHLLATPLKRWWREDWFTPVARVDQTGNEEYALHPCIYWPPRREAAALPPAPGGAARRLDDAQALARMVLDPTSPQRRTLVSEFTTDGGGELFLFVNDAVLAWPGRTGAFYRNNRGTATVTVERVHNDAASPYQSYCPR